MNTYIAELNRIEILSWLRKAFPKNIIELRLISPKTGYPIYGLYVFNVFKRVYFLSNVMYEKAENMNWLRRQEIHMVIL